jgi:5-methylcytosine-specific restriction endonuclease McrA
MAGPNAGRRGRRWNRLKANQRAKRLPCWLCGQPINYNLKAPHPDSFSVDHAKPWVTHPALREDPANLRSAHYGCNSSRQDKPAEQVALNNTSEAW